MVHSSGRIELPSSTWRWERLICLHLVNRLVYYMDYALDPPIRLFWQQR
jgi:hypothetical protein